MEPMLGAKIVWAFFISVTLMEMFLTCCHVPCAQNLLLMGFPPCCMRILPFLCPGFLDLWSLLYFLQHCAQTRCNASCRWVYSYDSIYPFCFFKSGSVFRVYGWWKCHPCHCIWCCLCLLPSYKTEHFLTHFREGIPLQYYSELRKKWVVPPLE